VADCTFVDPTKPVKARCRELKPRWCSVLAAGSRRLRAAGPHSRARLCVARWWEACEACCWGSRITAAPYGACMLTLYPAVRCRARMACPVKKAGLGGCGRADGRTARRQVVPILRAGLVLLEQAMTVLPASETYHVGYVRDEITLQARRTPRCLGGGGAGGGRLARLGTCAAVLHKGCPRPALPAAPGAVRCKRSDHTVTPQPRSTQSHLQWL